MSEKSEVKKWQSEESVSFMNNLAKMLHPLSGENQEAFREGYRSGMQDPESNQKEVANLQTLLGECEEAMSDLISMEILIYGRISNLHGGAIINLNNVLQKIKAARGGK